MTVLDRIKSIAKTVKQIDDIELYSQILDLQGQIMELLQQNNDLRTQLDELQSKLKIKENLTFRDNAYWIENSEQVDGPFCSNCWDTKQIMVRLLDHQNGLRICPNCKNKISTEGIDFDLGPLTINNLW